MTSIRNPLIIGLTALFASSVLVCPRSHGQDIHTGDPAPWTVMIYGGVDSSSEPHIMPHLRSLSKSSADGQCGEVLLLIDRAPGHSGDEKTLGENFEDTRLYQLKRGTWQRVSGGKQFPEIDTTSTFEANTGDALTLRKFIEFGKTFAPARKYALIVFGHGDCRSVCPDESSPCEERNEIDDPLYVAEITGQLSDQESVDLIWFDVCSFGAIENVWQLRPGNGKFSTAAMLATPPVSSPAPMAAILEGVGILGQELEQEKMPVDGGSFGTMAVDIIRDHYENRFAGFKEAWSCYDLTAAADVKHAVDRLAVALAESIGKEMAEQIRGDGKRPPTMNYMHTSKDVPRMWVVSPHFDLYDLAKRFSNSPDASDAVRLRAREVMKSVDHLIVASFGGSRYKGFEPGKNGIYIVFPDGDGVWRDNSQWSAFQWYHPDDRSHIRYAFGKYAWCADGATSDNGKVENWFELMDCWFDTNDEQGGVNQYRW